MRSSASRRQSRRAWESGETRKHAQVGGGGRTPWPHFTRGSCRLSRTHGQGRCWCGEKRREAGRSGEKWRGASGERPAPSQGAQREARAAPARGRGVALNASAAPPPSLASEQRLRAVLEHEPRHAGPPHAWWGRVETRQLWGGLRRAPAATASFQAAAAALWHLWRRPEPSEPPGGLVGRCPPTGRRGRFPPAGTAEEHEQQPEDGREEPRGEEQHAAV